MAAATSAHRLLPLLLLPGLGVLFFGFNAGGYFADGQGVGILVLGFALIALVLFSERPFAGVSLRVAVAAGALAAFALWSLASASWSDAPERALLDFHRCLLYLAAVVLFGAIERTEDRLRWLLRGVLAAIAVIGVVALVTRVLPDVWPTSVDIGGNRLSYPLTYWNALGVLAALGIVLAAGVTADLEEPPAARILAAPVLPLLASTLYFTFSRGAIVAAIVGVVVLLLVARPRALPSLLLAGGLPTALALVACYDAELLSSTDPTSQAAEAEGEGLALLLAAIAVGAAALRAVLLPLDVRLRRWPGHGGRTAGRVLVGGAAVAAAVAIVALDVPDRIHRQVDEFKAPTAQAPAASSTDNRNRLTDTQSKARVDHWRVALDAFDAEPLHGTGAATFEVLWNRDRPRATQQYVVDAHSLYLEVLAETGVVGLVLLVTAFLALIAPLALRCRGPARVLHGALLAACLTWALHAAVDWDWEVPAVTVWLFAATALAAARPAGERRSTAPYPLRLTIAIVVAAIAVVPAAITLSQGHLDEATAAFARGDCATAQAAADRALDTLDVRAQAYEIAGYCAIRDERYADAVRHMQAAIGIDPRNGDLHYGLALARGAGGDDPRRAIARARALSRQDALIIDAQRLFDTDDRRQWERWGRRLAARLTEL